MTDGGVVISWGIDEEPGLRDQCARVPVPLDSDISDAPLHEPSEPPQKSVENNQQDRVPGRPACDPCSAEAPDPHTGGEGEHLCAALQAEVASLREEASEWRRKAQMFQCQSELRDRHMDEVNRERIYLRSVVDECRKEIKALQLPWWVKLMGALVRWFQSIAGKKENRPS